VFGELPADGPARLLDVTVPRPADWFSAGLKEALARHGIRVDGIARSLRWPDPAATGPASVKLGEIASPPLREMVTAFMKLSQNLETDLIFDHLGETSRAGDAPALQTSEQSAVARLQDFLRRNGLPADDVRFTDGSGLSQYNLTTPRATLELLKFMSTHRAAADFIASLPVAGVDGTLGAT
jgi:D-alanyl-D-alanine carboxypeptidase/D-alanyl-D-alanine-endopeptidase (penicillin-binding protein 4)